MSITSHATLRAYSRLTQSVDAETAFTLVTRAEAFASRCGAFESVALRLSTIPMVGQAWSANSNGDTIVAIIRNRQVTTFMFRRLTQPFTPANLNVDRTVTL